MDRRAVLSKKVVTSEFESSSGADIDSVAVVPAIMRERGLGPLLRASEAVASVSWRLAIKRAIDIAGSLLLIIATLPIMAAVAFVVWLDSDGPILFSEKDDGQPVMRIGKGGKPFRYFKFRSMRPKCDSSRYAPELAVLNLRANSPFVKFAEDSRVTRVGKFIRKFSLDEFPEFFLVLRGHMSLVGPRPHLPEEVAKYPAYGRTSPDEMRPGITGLAQINGRANNTFERENDLDWRYCDRWRESPFWKVVLLDIAILLATPLAVIRKTGAY